MKWHEIVKWRRTRDMSQEDLAMLLGVSRRVIQAWENPMLEDLEHRLQHMEERTRRRIEGPSKLPSRNSRPVVQLKANDLPDGGAVLPVSRLQPAAEEPQVWTDAPPGLSQARWDYLQKRTTTYVPPAGETEG